MYLGRRTHQDFSSHDYAEAPKPGAPGAAPATWREIFDTTWESTRLAGEMLSRVHALEEAYDARIEAIFRTTGVRLAHPGRVVPEADPEEATARLDPVAEFQAELQRLAQQKPEHADVIGADRPVSEDAARLAREAEARFEDVWGRSDGVLGPWSARIAAGLGRSVRDPVNLATLPFGFGAGTGVKAVLWAALKNGALNAGAEATAQPFVQSWRREAGLSYGLGQAAEGVGTAFAFGFGIDAAGRAMWRGVRYVQGRVPQLDAGGQVARWVDPAGGAPEGHVPVPGPNGQTVAFRPQGAEPPNLPAGGQVGDRATLPPPDPETALDEAAGRLPLDHPARRALEGNVKAADELADQLGMKDSPEYRGARQAADIEQELDPGAPPPLVNPDEDLAARLQAFRAIVDADEAPPLAVDPVPPARHAPLTNDAPRPSGAVTIDGKPVRYVDLRASAIGTDAATFQFKGGADARGVTQRLAGVDVWDPLAAGRVIVFERADGTQVIADGHQRLALAKRLEAAGAEPPRLEGWVFREADGWTPEDVRVIAARKNLQEGSGDVLDAARIIRERPEVIDSSVPLSAHSLRQARALAKLSDTAFAAVMEGRVPPNHAAHVGDLVASRAQHADMIRAIEQAAPANERQARQIVSELSQMPNAEVQRVVMDGGSMGGGGVLLAERASVLDAAVRALKDDARIFQIVSRETLRLEEVGSRIAVDASADRAVRSTLVANLLTEVAAQPGPLSRLLDDAARRVAAGTPVKQAADDLARAVREALERGGMAALRPDAPQRLAGVRGGIDDPGGAEAKAQVAELQQALQGRLEASNRRAASRALRDHFAREAEAGRPQPPLTPRQREVAIEAIAGGELVRTAVQKAKNEAVKAARTESEIERDALAAFERLGKVLRGEERPPAPPEPKAEPPPAPADTEATLARLRDQLQKRMVSKNAGRELADATVRLGETYDVERMAPGVVAAGRQALADLSDLIELVGGDRWKVGVVERIKPLKARAVGDPSDPIVAVTFRAADGSSFVSRGRLSVFGVSAFADPSQRHLGIMNFGGHRREALDVGMRGDETATQAPPQAIAPLDFATYTKGTAIHEILHALWDDIDLRWRQLLIDHANRLSVLEKSRYEMDQLIQLEPPRTPSPADQQTVRAHYRKYYEDDFVRTGDDLNDPDVIVTIDELINEEAAAHLAQLAYLGRLSPEELAPVREALEKIFNGKRAHFSRVFDADQRTGPRYMLEGETAATRRGGEDLTALHAAQDMERAGRTEAEIERLTGWFRDDNGAWAREFSDQALQLRPEAQAAFKGRQAGTTGPAAALFSHPDLYRRYPELAWLSVELRRRRSPDDVATMKAAGFANEAGLVPGRTAFADLNAGRIRIVAATPAEAAQKFAVEMHRFIARAEGMAAGGSPVSAADVVSRFSRSMDGDLAAALERLAVLDEGRHVDPLFGRMAERNAAAVELARLRAVRIELDRLSPIEAYNRLSGTVAGRAIAARLRLGEAGRRRAPFTEAQDVPPERRIVTNRGPERQFGNDWEDDAWSEMARRAHVFDEAEARREQGRVGRDQQALDLNKRTLTAIRNMERKLLDEGKTLGEVAAALEARFGMPFDMSQIGQREVWWRLDEIVAPRRKSPGRPPTWTQGHLDEVARLWRQGAGVEDIAERLSRMRGRTTSPMAVRAKVHELGLEARRADWTDEATAEMLRLYRDGVGVDEIAQRMTELRGVPTTATAVRNRVGIVSETNVRRARTLDWLTEEREASLEDMVRRGLTDAEILAEFKRDPGLADVPLSETSILSARQRFGLTKRPPTSRGPKPGSPWADPEVMAALTSDDIARLSLSEAAAAMTARFAPRWTFTRTQIVSKRRTMEISPPLIEAEQRRQMAPGDAERDTADELARAADVAKNCKL